LIQVINLLKHLIILILKGEIYYLWEGHMMEVVGSKEGEDIYNLETTHN
jgi:hypothetical protein